MKTNIFSFLKKLKYLLPFVINTYLFALGLGWVFVHLFFRIILERKPFFFEDIKYDLSSKHIIIFVLFIILHLILICANIFILYKKNEDENKIKLPKLFILISEKLNSFVNLLYWKPLEFLHDLIAPRIPYSGNFFLYLEKTWVKNNYGENYFHGMIFLFDSLPKIIISISFFIDIVIYTQMKYFFYFVPFILIPITFSIFLKLMISFSVRNIPTLRDYFSEIKGLYPIYNKRGRLMGYKKYEWTVKPEYVEVIDPEEEMLLLLQLDHLQGFGLGMKEDLKNLNIYITLITSSIYLISGVVRFCLLIT